MNVKLPLTPLKTIFACSFALTAFAANSVLCRMALGTESIDAGSFTVIRMLSGVLALSLINLQFTKAIPTSKNHTAAFFLFLYAITFSYAYITLDTGTGALILFTSVQLCMITASILSGNRLHRTEWLGSLIAFSGFVYLVYPHLSAPSLTGFILMTSAGIAWGIYSLIGKSSRNPLQDTHANFIGTVPYALILAVIIFNYAELTSQGIVLAIASGAIASGIGYAIWYKALNGLSAVQAAVAQLLVPVLAAYGGVLFSNEQLSWRLILALMLISCGITILIFGRRYFDKHNSSQKN